MNNYLPNGWATTSIEHVTGRAAQRQPQPEEEFFYIDISSVDREIKRIVSPQRLLGNIAPSRARQVVKAGDVLVSMTRPNLNAVALVSEELDCQIASTGFDVLRPVEIQSRWLFYLVRSSKFVAAMSDLVQGALYPAVRPRDIRSFEFPLAPLNEQKRIVDKLDAVLTRVDTCLARLDRIPAILKRFRQSVLAAAISGKLTEDWRSDHHISNEWTIRKLGTLTAKVGSGATPKGGEAAYKKEGVPLIRSMNVIFYGFKRSGLAFIDAVQAHELRNVEVQENDVLLNITGASIGRVTLAPVDMSGARVNQHVCIVRPNHEMLAGYLCAFLSSPAMQAVIGAENYGVTRQALTKQQILDFNIPVPSLDEQAEIVRRIEALFFFIDSIETRYQKSRAQVEKLTPALLAKAFRGELVPQDPNDEPAVDLLTRVASKAAVGSHSRRVLNKPKSEQVILNALANAKDDAMKKQSLSKLEDVAATHLANILEPNKKQDAKALWMSSGLSIDDFYVQLSHEISAGHLRVSADDESLLELVTSKVSKR